MYYIGFDLGSSSVKAALIEASTGKSLGVVQEPKEEMGMYAQKNGGKGMKNKTVFFKTKLTLYLTLLLLVLSIQNSNSQTFCIQAGSDQIAGVQNGFRYELWNQNSQGTACMTLGNGALFSGEWSGILNYLSRRGLSYNQTQEHQDIGEFFATYNCDYNPSSASGNSYLSIYGWTVSPLIEYYVIEDWRNWIPSMASGSSLKGTITVNGSTYDIYENTRTNQPSIIGTATFQQYFSIRRDVRNSGTINISDHFDKWESLGMDLGKLHEVSFVVEGYQSSGNFEFTDLDVYTNTLGTNESKLPKHLNVYPNPTSDKLYIQNSLQVNKIGIIDIAGRTVLEFNKANNLKSIDVSNLTNGVYFLKTDLGSQLKFIKK